MKRICWTILTLVALQLALQIVCISIGHNQTGLKASHLASKTHSFSLNESTNEIFQHSNTTLVPLGAHHDVSQQHLPSTLKPTNIITRHACFSNLNLDQCHQSASQFESECMWCDYWCIFKEPMIGCNNHSHEMDELFSMPKIISVKPLKIFAHRYEVIHIYGSYLDKMASKNVFNSVNEILIDNKHLCEIHVKNYSYIRCVLNEIHNVGELPIKITFKRNVYSLTKQIETCLNFSIHVEKLLSPHEYKPFRKWLFSNSFQVMLGLVIGILLCSFVWMSYINRYQVELIIESVRKHYLLKKHKKQLIEQNLLVEFKKIQIKDKLGEGNFGSVFAATLTTQLDQQINVAVKKLKKGASLAKIEMFFREGIQMSSFNHDRILVPQAIFIDRLNRMPAIVLPLMENGDLRRYLNPLQSFKFNQLLKFSLQIAEGMEYLSSKNFVHGDLAIRNCLLDSNFDIKIGDFGMSHHIYKSYYISIKNIYCPIRWMAIECLATNHPKFTLKSDVWSYGVVLWEIFTIGSHPYEELKDSELFEKIKSGYRLSKPSSCLDPIYKLMLKCWCENWKQRPTFTSIIRQLKAFFDATETDHRIFSSSSCYTTMAEQFNQPRTNSIESC